jgi:hypothetical protein
MDMLDFKFAINNLKSLKDSLIQETKSGKKNRDIQNKIAEIQKAISCLEMCASFGLSDKANITKLPISERSFGYYRIVEYDEMDNQVSEFSVGGKPFDLLGANLIIELKDKFR